jgi:hypothetical protein
MAFARSNCRWTSASSAVPTITNYPVLSRDSIADVISGLAPNQPWTRTRILKLSSSFNTCYVVILACCPERTVEIGVLSPAPW